MSFGKQSAPATPDYAGAAQATAAGNLEAAKFATKANRVNQYTPYGNLTYSQNPDETWNQYVNLSDTGKKLLGYQDAASLGLGEQTTNALGRVDQSLSTPFDYGSIQDAGNAAYAQETSRLDPQWNQRQGQLETQLANQGIARGTEAYTNAMRDFNNGRNDAYSQARVNAYNMAPTQFQLAQSIRSQPLNELNALRTGAQVTNPTFSSVPQQATTAGPDLLGAAQATYNGQLAGVNAANQSASNFTSGLMGLGGAALMSPTGTFSWLKR